MQTLSPIAQILQTLQLGPSLIVDWHHGSAPHSLPVCYSLHLQPPWPQLAPSREAPRSVTTPAAVCVCAGLSHAPLACGLLGSSVFLVCSWVSPPPSQPARGQCPWQQRIHAQKIVSHSALQILCLIFPAQLGYITGCHACKWFTEAIHSTAAPHSANLITNPLPELCSITEHEDTTTPLDLPGALH